MPFFEGFDHFLDGAIGWDQTADETVTAYHGRFWKYAVGDIVQSSHTWSGQIDSSELPEGITMDSRYSQTAKAVMFSARLEAINAGSLYVEPEHLLLALLRRSSQVIQAHMELPASIETIERELKSNVPVQPSLATYVQTPFSPASNQILGIAAQEAERHSHETVGTEHILLAILRDEQCPASRLLQAKGMRAFVPSEDQQTLEAS